MSVTRLRSNYSHPDHSHLARFRYLTRLLDEAIRLPGSQRRIGLDALLGLLLPGAGDALGTLLASYGVIVAARFGVPPPILLRMLLNIGLDTVAGAVPLIGDLFDFAWKANSRNLALLEQYIEKPAQTHVTSRWLLFGLVALLIAIAGGALWLAVVSIRALLGVIG